VTEAGDLVPLEEQDRGLWDRAAIDEGVRVLDEALALRRPGPYQTQAAIAALHAQAATPAGTDWTQIAALYDALYRHTPTPVVAANRAVAIGLSAGLDRGLDEVLAIERQGELARHYLLPASKADLLRRLRRHAEAAAAYGDALALVTSPAERRYLERRLSETRK
jgi:RNA polymerase sigma-70 factor (ECF subfamily)